MSLLKFIVIILVTILFLLLIYIISVTNDTLDFCLDTGNCKEGLYIRTQSGQTIININNCIKNNGQWISDKKYCQFK